MTTRLLLILIVAAAWIFVGWVIGRVFNIHWRALFFIAIASAASIALPSAAEARHRHHHMHHHLAPQARVQATLFPAGKDAGNDKTRLNRMASEGSDKTVPKTVQAGASPATKCDPLCHQLFHEFEVWAIM